MSIEWLNEFTKEEIIAWIMQESRFMVRPPNKSDLLFIKWQIKASDAEKVRAKSLEMLQSCDGKARDALAEKFNEETDSTKKLALLRQMKPYEDQFKKWLDYEKIVARHEKEADRVYAEMEAVRKLESKQ